MINIDPFSAVVSASFEKPDGFDSRQYKCLLMN